MGLGAELTRGGGQVSVKDKEECQLTFMRQRIPKRFGKLLNVEYILNNFRISIHILSNGMDSFDVTLVWSDYMDGGTNKVKTSRQGLGGDGHLY